MKKSGLKYRMLIAAAAAALPALAMPVFAQQRVGNDGHALDANNRIGSGGYNTSGTNDLQITPNEIVYGNVTGGRQFRGPVGSTDPRAFTGPMPGMNVDRFVRDSSGAPSAFAPRTDLTQPQPYYGVTRGVAPPPGYTLEGFSGGYVKSNVSPGRTSGDIRLGDPFTGVENVTLPQPGESIYSGAQVSSQTNNTLITASPLYGIRQWQPNNPDQSSSLQNFTAIAAPLPPVNPGDQSKQPTDAQQPKTSSPQQQPMGQQPMGAPLPPLGYTPAQSSQQQQGQLPNQPLDNSVLQPSGSYQLLTPAERTPQYQQMHQRLEEFYKSQNLSDAQAKQLADQQMKLRMKAQAAKQKQDQEQPSAPTTPPPTPSSNTPAKPLVPDFNKEANQILQQQPTPDQGIVAQAVPSPQTGASAVPPPVRIESLAQGIKAPGLADEMARGEQLMAEGKFSSAIDHYKAAQRISPNNALVMIGRANAELGGGYYTQAAVHLREAYLADPTVAMGQFDLKKMIGDKRLTQIVSDLKQVADKDKQSPAPIFLLSYIAYNSGSTDLAARWLDEADRRAGGHDLVFDLLKSHWSLPSTQPGAAPSK